MKPEDTIVKFDNGGIIGDGNKSFVFGPCSVESQEQVDAVAQDLQAKGEKFIRGGAFKPRTSPYDFQGLGVEGLKILKNVKDKYNLNVVSEIVNPNDFEIASDYLMFSKLVLEICKILSYSKKLVVQINLFY